MARTNVIIEIELVPEECYSCGMVFGLPTAWKARRREDHQTFYCPAGHAQCYTGVGEADKLRKQLKDQQARLADEERRSKAAEYSLHLRSQELAAAKQILAVTRGQLTKTRKRIENGVCPDCHRHFENLEKHMQSKHVGVRTGDGTGERDA